MQMANWSVSNFRIISLRLIVTDRILNDRCRIYSVLVMQMARWCLLMLPVRKEFQVCYNWCNFSTSSSFCFNIIWWNICPTVVEQVTGRDHVLNHLSIPAACFTHPEISMVGLTEVYHNFVLFDVWFTATCYNEWVIFLVWLNFFPFFYSFILFSLCIFIQYNFYL